MVSRASKKVGSAVMRNRARRRLRALARDILSLHASPECRYVFIARASKSERSYAHLQEDLEKALQKLKVWREGS